VKGDPQDHRVDKGFLDHQACLAHLGPREVKVCPEPKVAKVYLARLEERVSQDPQVYQE